MRVSLINTCNTPTKIRTFLFQIAAAQKLETFRALKHHLENLIARKTNFAFDNSLDLKAMILNPIVEWNAEAVAVIEHSTNLLMDSFRLTNEDVRHSVDSVKSDIENDKKTKKNVTA